MNVRDSNVVHAHEIFGEIPLKALALGLVQALEEAEIDGVEDPSRDPAVLVFGAFIAFHTHADVSTIGGYLDKIEECRERYETARTMQ